MAEIASRLNDDPLFVSFREKCETAGSSVGAAVLAVTYEAIEYAHNRTKLVVRHMPQYTLHDSDHLFRVLRTMSRLIPTDTLGALSIPEMQLLVLSAFFHDIGMAPGEEEVVAWKRSLSDESGSEIDGPGVEDFRIFCSARPETIETIRRMDLRGDTAEAETVRQHVVSEYIRFTHADRAREILATEWAGKIRFGEYDLTSELAEICFSHNGNAMSLLDLETSVNCGGGQYVCLPFVGVILRLSDILDFDSKRTPEVLYAHLMIRNPVSLEEWRKHRSIQAWDISNEYISFSARCGHPAVEYSIRKFCDLIDEELKSCTMVLNSLNDTVRDLGHYRIKLSPRVDRSKIGPEIEIRTGQPKYIYRETSFHLNKRQVVDLLMGTRLYGNPEIAIRELLQNSIDACLLAKSLCETWGIPYLPRIRVRYYEDNEEEFLEVDDNGIGMNQYIIDTYYTNIGNSFYSSSDFNQLKAQTTVGFTPISRFGIGVLSYFMVSDSIHVQTRKINGRYEYDDALDIKIEGQDSIFHITNGIRKEPGTCTTLLLRKEHPWRTLSKSGFVASVRKTIPNPPFPIDIESEDKVEQQVPYVAGTLSTLPLRGKHSWEIDEQYIHEYELDIIREDLGMIGRATVAVIEERDEPVERIQVSATTVQAEGEDFELELAIDYTTNGIEKRASSIELEDDGGLHLSHSSSWLARSSSVFSVHGIQYPNELFAQSYESGKLNRLRWPLPVLLILDVSGPFDLDLNSARTEIIANEKFQSLERDLIGEILGAVRQQVSPEYWRKLSEILKQRSKDSLFGSVLGNL